MLRIDVLIVSYNSGNDLRNCIDSIMRWRPASEEPTVSVMVWDNASQDESVAMLRNLYPDITVIQSSQNLGFGRAHNRLVALSSADFVLMLNPDAVLLCDVFTPMCAELTASYDVALVGPRITSDRGYEPSAQRFPRLRDELELSLRGTKVGCVILPLLRHVGPITPPLALPAVDTGQRDVPFLWATCILMRRDTALTLGPFAPEFFLYDEDLELCFRVAKARLRSVQLSEPSIFHAGGASSTAQQKSAFMRRGRYLYYLKTSGRFAAIAYLLVSESILRAKVTKAWVQAGYESVAGRRGRPSCGGAR